MSYLVFKRTIDIVMSFVGIIILSPLLLIICVAIKIDSKGPILFVQRRIGQHKKNFYILKFRTMKVDTPKNMPTHLLTNPEKWITNIGKFLRKSSLDELPQIFNILKGDMSIIGPRPALWNQHDLIIERDKYGVNDLPVGLTGWAQIQGRDTLDIKNKAKLDCYYKEHFSFLMDTKCFIYTIISVVKSDGVVEGRIKKNFNSSENEVN